VAPKKRFKLKKQEQLKYKALREGEVDKLTAQINLSASDIHQLNIDFNEPKLINEKAK
jgi:hypothetical protein